MDEFCKGVAYDWMETFDLIDLCAHRLIKIDGLLKKILISFISLRKFHTQIKILQFSNYIRDDFLQ